MSVPTAPIEGVYWYDGDGNLTSDPDKVVQKVAAKTRQTKLAESAEEFEELYSRLATKTQFASNHADRQLIVATLVQETERLIDFHRNFAGLSSWNFKLISNAKRFILWLTGQELSPKGQAVGRKINHPSSLLPQIEIDFGALPDFVATSVIIDYFDFLLLTDDGNDSYKAWTSSLRERLEELTQDVRIDTLIKSIEYGEKALSVIKREGRDDMDAQ